MYSVLGRIPLVLSHVFLPSMLSCCAVPTAICCRQRSRASHNALRELHGLHHALCVERDTGMSCWSVVLRTPTVTQCHCVAGGGLEQCVASCIVPSLSCYFFKLNHKVYFTGWRIWANACHVNNSGSLQHKQPALIHSRACMHTLRLYNHRTL
jgi:hypothetical protein